MEKKRYFSDLYLFFLGYIAISQIVLLALYLHMVFHPPLVIITVLLFTYFLIVIFLGIRLSVLYFVSSAQKQLRFRKITGFLRQPKIVGTYKKHKFEIHFKDKEGGKYPGILRTYIKLIYKEDFNFDENKFKKKKVKVDGKTVFSIKQIVKADRSYILMKVSGFVFEKSTLEKLMSKLIDVCETCRK